MYLPNKPNERLTECCRQQLLKDSRTPGLHQDHRKGILIMLLADKGRTQAQICRRVKCCPSTARHWIVRARSGMALQWADCQIGRPREANDPYLARLRELDSSSPRNYNYFVGRWTARMLNQQLEKEFGVKLSEQHINKLRRKMGLSTRQNASNSQNQSE